MYWCSAGKRFSGALQLEPYLAQFGLARWNHVWGVWEAVSHLALVLEATAVRVAARPGPQWSRKTSRPRSGHRRGGSVPGSSATRAGRRNDTSTRTAPPEALGRNAGLPTGNGSLTSQKERQHYVDSLCGTLLHAVKDIKWFRLKLRRAVLQLCL